MVYNVRRRIIIIKLGLQEIQENIAGRKGIFASLTPSTLREIVPVAQRFRRICQYLTLKRVPAPKVLQNSRTFKVFSSNNSRPIQGLSILLHVTLDYWYSGKTV